MNSTNTSSGPIVNEACQYDIREDQVASLFDDACQIGHLNTAKYLYSIRGNTVLDLNFTLIQTCKNSPDSIDVVKYLVEELGANVQDVINHSLQMAYDKGNFKIAEYLISKNAHLEIMELLFNKGAKLDGK